MLGFDRNVQPNNNYDKDDIILVNVYQKINDKTNTISENSRNFADAVEAKIFNLIRQEEEMLIAA
ncbi:MAG: hypothetical protein EBR82_39450 [Caulobacteraceae bacterium]|nr:hypothetical protein [Caulobacteraceae bacterium]